MYMPGGRTTNCGCLTDRTVNVMQIIAGPAVKISLYGNLRGLRQCSSARRAVSPNLPVRDGDMRSINSSNCKAKSSTTISTSSARNSNSRSNALSNASASSTRLDKSLANFLQVLTLSASALWNAPSASRRPRSLAGDTTGSNPVLGSRLGLRRICTIATPELNSANASIVLAKGGRTRGRWTCAQFAKAEPQLAS